MQSKAEKALYQRGYSRKKYPELRDEVLKKLGSKCQTCGYDADYRALQIDHVAGDGRSERKKIGWYRFYKKILADSTGYQILCANCNYIKRYENDEVYTVGSRMKGIPT